MVQKSPLLTSTRARTRRALIEAALVMFDKGAFPSITEVAQAANLSRATAYRYFPTQSTLVSAIVEETLKPVNDFQPQQTKPEERVEELLSFAFPHMLQHEGSLRAAIHMSLTQWALSRTNNHSPSKEKLIRGNRKNMLRKVTSPLEDELTPELYQKVLFSLSLIYGSEIFLVMKDIWGSDDETLIEIARWMARAVIRQAKDESKGCAN